MSGPVSSIPRVMSRLRARSSVLDKLRKAMGTVVVRGERVTPSQSHSHMYVIAQPRICMPYTLLAGGSCGISGAASSSTFGIGGVVLDRPADGSRENAGARLCPQEDKRVALLQ
jgi:hypothetical protein